MTIRTANIRALNTTARVANTRTGVGLAVIFLPDLPLILPLPAKYCDANQQKSIRSVTLSSQAQESTTTYFAQGKVMEAAAPVSRLVVVLRRDTGDKVASTVSGGNGFFHVRWTGYGGEVAVVILSKDNTGNNAKVFDLVTGIS